MQPQSLNRLHHPKAVQRPIVQVALLLDVRRKATG